VKRTIVALALVSCLACGNVDSVMHPQPSDPSNPTTKPTPELEFLDGKPRFLEAYVLRDNTNNREYIVVKYFDSGVAITERISWE
jgi:hypothetical protein